MYIIYLKYNRRKRFILMSLQHLFSGSAFQVRMGYTWLKISIVAFVVVGFQANGSQLEENMLKCTQSYANKAMHRICTTMYEAMSKAGFRERIKCQIFQAHSECLLRMESCKIAIEKYKSFICKNKSDTESVTETLTTVTTFSPDFKMKGSSIMRNNDVFLSQYKYLGGVTLIIIVIMFVICAAINCYRNNYFRQKYRMITCGI